MKYIDAERQRAFLQKKLESYKSKMVDPSKYPIDHIDLMAFLASEYQALIIQLDSLQQEQPEVDLEKEIETNIRLLNGLHTLEDNKSWYKGRYEELKEFARHFYELGKNSRQ